MLSMSVVGDTIKIVGNEPQQINEKSVSLSK
jgi:hypothetical protein